MGGRVRELPPLDLGGQLIGALLYVDVEQTRVVLDGRVVALEAETVRRTVAV